MRVLRLPACRGEWRVDRDKAVLAHVKANRVAVPVALQRGSEQNAIGKKDEGACALGTVVLAGGVGIVIELEMVQTAADARSEEGCFSLSPCDTWLTTKGRLRWRVTRSIAPIRLSSPPDSSETQSSSGSMCSARRSGMNTAI